MNQKRKFVKYLDLFGLATGFNEDDLKKAYRTLAKINHPDVNPEESAKIRMILINEGYAFLSENIDSLYNINETVKKENPYDYTLYKEGFDLMKKAFDEYFGYEDSTVKNDRTILNKRLTVSKEKFAQIIKEHPESEWVSDSIDKIFSINVWIDY